MTRIVLISNGASGRGKNPEEVLSNTQIELVDTVKIQDAESFISNICEESYDVICVWGGDGSVSFVYQLAFKYNVKLPILALPGGTTNDIVKSIYGTDNVETLISKLKQVKSLDLDLGEVNGKLFTYACTFGYMSNVPYITPQKAKNKFGYFAYLVRGSWELLKLKKYKLKVVIGDEVIKSPGVCFASVTNTKKMANLVRFPEGVELSDGIFELLLVRSPNNPYDFFKSLHQVVKTDYDGKYVKLHSFDQIQLISDKDIEYGLDGEFGGFAKVLNFKVHRHAVKIIK